MLLSTCLPMQNVRRSKACMTILRTKNGLAVRQRTCGRRPVICPDDAATTPVSNVLYNTTIVSSHLENGWGVNAWAGQHAPGSPIVDAITQQLQANVTKGGVISDAVCFTFDLDKVPIKMHMHACACLRPCSGHCTATGWQ